MRWQLLVLHSDLLQPFWISGVLYVKQRLCFCVTMLVKIIYGLRKPHSLDAGRVGNTEEALGRGSAGKGVWLCLKETFFSGVILTANRSWGSWPFQVAPFSEVAIVVSEAEKRKDGWLLFSQG